MILVAIIFIILGILIKYGKMYFLIAGYNTMTTEKKAKYNIDGIATLMRNVMFAMAIVIILGYFISKWLDKPNLEMIFMFIAILIGIPYLLIKANSNKYKIKQ
ncbi:DUF3784 domain-containing protein [Aequorivita marina]|uniref:DUF3784 domain-containing protein n=1 Tax=Aequorivita marina TaxID=3073654 RepID=UPI002874CADA|nr:DUF3784 domain-containing protein [Aequorivita sp. S2608]MDS1298699.1 DUF3784 domain-containing protein [Aequorivita sp. S2608]